MCRSHLKIYVLIPFLLMLLAATGAHATLSTGVQVVSLTTDATFNGPTSASDPKSAVNGTITSNLWTKWGYDPTSPNPDANPNAWMAQSGNAFATASQDGNIAVSAFDNMYQFTATATNIYNITTSGNFGFTIDGGSLGLSLGNGGSVSYWINILQNNSTVWTSSAVLSQINNPVPFAFPGVIGDLTKNGTDLNGNFISASGSPLTGYNSSYVFGAFSDSITLAAGDTLQYTMGVSVFNGGYASIGDPMSLTGGFSATITPSTQVPEPATALLLGAGLLGVAGFRKRMKK